MDHTYVCLVVDWQGWRQQYMNLRERTQNQSGCLVKSYSSHSKGNRLISSPKCPDRLWGPPRLLFNVYRFFGGSAMLATTLQLNPTLKINGATQCTLPHPHPHPPGNVPSWSGEDKSTVNNVCDTKSDIQPAFRSSSTDGVPCSHTDRCRLAPALNMAMTRTPGLISFMKPGGILYWWDWNCDLPRRSRN